jgi:hypothetical protein
MVSPRALGHEFETFLRAWTFMIGFDIKQRLPDEGLVA